MSKSFLHELDCGDIIHSLATVQAAGGGKYWLKLTKPRLQGLVGPLVAAQEYIESFGPWRRQAVTHDFSTFRKGGIPWGIPLGELHARWVRVKTDFSKPWLAAKPSARSSGKIVVNRTARYHNPYFPWKDIARELGHKMIFVGLEQEWRTFCNLNCKYLEFARTDNMLEVAELIAGSELFIGNQSSPNAVAEGLKHPLVQETCLHVPDCIYPRRNAVHCSDGNVSFEFLGQEYSFDAVLPSLKVSHHETPSGGWQVPINGTTYSHYCFQALVNNVKKTLRADCPPNLIELIEEFTFIRLGLRRIPSSDLEKIAKIRELSSAFGETTPASDAN